MINTIAPIETCKACQMELTPYILMGEKFSPRKHYCDDKCKFAWKYLQTKLVNSRKQAEKNALRVEELSTEGAVLSINLRL